MFCDEALDRVEAIAAGDMTPDGRVAAHLSTCPNCASALESARQVDASLRRRPVPAAPAQFTARTLARVRRARWRSDQFLDVGFNLAIGAVVLLMVGGLWMLFARTGVGAVTGDAVSLFGSGFVVVAKRVAPSLPLYLGAARLLASALGIWGWAERDTAL